jgi:hypothetical protein
VTTLHLCAAALATLVVACDPSSSPRAPADHGGSMKTLTTLRWTTYSPTTGLTAAILEDAPTASGGDARAGSVITGHQPVRVGLRWGAGEDLASWRDGILANPGAVAGAESGVTVCGVAARRVEVTTPGGPPVDVTHTDGRHERLPAPGETFIAVAFRHGDVPVVAYYVVETARRAAFAGDEGHFFGALACA